MPKANTGIAKPGYAAWEKHHTSRVVTGIIQAALASKSSIYRLPGLAGEVDGHGSDRIHKKIEQVLKKLASEYGLDWADVAGKSRAGGGQGGRAGKQRKLEEMEVKGEEVE